MRKLIETKREHIIVCDNTNCDYKIPSSEEEINIIQYINEPCPLCGENLLTEQDYLQDLKLMRTINWINKWFSWITIFYSKKSLNNTKEISVHVHDGVKIKM